MGYVARGIALVLGDRRFWPFIARPMLISLAIFLGVIGLGYFLLVPLAERGLSNVGLNAQVAAAGVKAVYLVLLWLISSLLFVTIAGLTSSFLWDRLSYEVETTVMPSPPKQQIDARLWVADTLPRAAFATLIFCMSTGCFWLLPVGVVLASWLCLYDYTAAVYLRRGIPFLAQFRVAHTCKGAWTFALSCGLLTLLPFVNVLLLPGLVAGGTLMVAENESARRNPT